MNCCARRWADGRHEANTQSSIIPSAVEGRTSACRPSTALGMMGFGESVSSLVILDVIGDPLKCAVQVIWENRDGNIAHI